MKSKMVFLIFVLAFGMAFSGNAEAAKKDGPTERSGKGLSLVKPVGGILKGVTETTTKTVEHTVKATTDTVEATTAGVTETVNETVSGTTGIVKEAGSAVTETVRTTTNEVVKVPTVKPVADTANKVLEPVLDAVDGTVSTATKTVHTTVQETTSAVNQTVEATGDLVGDVSNTASETVQITVNESVNVVEKVTEPVREVVRKPLPKPVQKPAPQDPIKTKPQQTEKPRPQEPAEPETEVTKLEEPKTEPEPGKQTKPDVPKQDREPEATIEFPAQQVKPVVADKQEAQKQAAEIQDMKKEPTAAFIIEEIIKQETAEKHMNQDSKVQQKQDNQRTVVSFVKELVNQKARFAQQSFEGEMVASITKPIEKQQDEEELLKEWERSFIAQPPAQPQQSATVIHGGPMGGGLTAVLGDSIMTGLQLIDQWTSQADYLSNQWVHAPPGQPPQFSPFLLSRI